MNKLSKKLREQLLAELTQHERLTLKAIGCRHGVSRQTLSRLRAEVLRRLRGKMPQEAKCLIETADASAAEVSTLAMIDVQRRRLEARITELERRLAETESESVRLPRELLAIVDEASLARGVDRRIYARAAIEDWMAVHPALFGPLTARIN